MERNTFIVTMDDYENTLRTATVCPGCGKPIEVGMIVCWGCFKHPSVPLKYWEHPGTYQEWFESWLTARKAVDKGGVA